MVLTRHEPPTGKVSTQTALSWAATKPKEVKDHNPSTPDHRPQYDLKVPNTNQRGSNTNRKLPIRMTIDLHTNNPKNQGNPSSRKAGTSKKSNEEEDLYLEEAGDGPHMSQRQIVAQAFGVFGDDVQTDFQEEKMQSVAEELPTFLGKGDELAAAKEQAK